MRWDYQKNTPIPIYEEFTVLFYMLSHWILHQFFEVGIITLCDLCWEH